MNNAQGAVITNNKKVICERTLSTLWAFFWKLATNYWKLIFIITLPPTSTLHHVLGCDADAI